MYILYVHIDVHSGDCTNLFLFSLYIYYNRFLWIFQIIRVEFYRRKNLIVGQILPGTYLYLFVPICTNYTILSLIYYPEASRVIRVGVCVVGPITSLYLHLYLHLYVHLARRHAKRSIYSFCLPTFSPICYIYTYLPTHSFTLLLYYLYMYFLPTYYIYIYLPTYLPIYYTIYV